MTRDYRNHIANKRREYGDKFDASDLAPQFIEHFESGARIEVEFVGQAGNVYETKRGTVGITTGWKPVFLLMLTSRSIGSSHILRAKDRIVRVVRRAA